MAKGFKTKIGNKIKFVPTDAKPKSSISSKDIRKKKTTQKSSGEDLKQRKMHTVKDVWSFEEAPPELKEKILEKLREREYENTDDFFADYDGVIYDKKTQLADYDLFTNYSKKYYDLDRGQYIQFPELQVKDEAKLLKVLGLPKSITDKVSIDFDSSRLRESNTEINFHEESSGSNLAIGVYNGITYEEYKKDTSDEENPLTKKEFELIEKATEKWNDLMHEAWSGLRDNYEYQFTDEALKERAISNEYDFDEDGDIV